MLSELLKRSADDGTLAVLIVAVREDPILSALISMPGNLLHSNGLPRCVKLKFLIFGFSD